VADDQIEQVDVGEAQLGSAFGNLCEEKDEVLAHLQLPVRGIVEGVERDLVAETLAVEEVVGRDPVEDPVQPIVEIVTHSVSSMHRSA
jgi:hypothetical protein